MSVVHCKKEKYDVYIGRPSKWGNPFEMKSEEDREYVVQKYRLWINTQPNLLLDLHELTGKTLGCFCSPKSCHGDVLAELSSSKWIKNWFSNMLPLDKPIESRGITYKTVEHFYQAHKVAYELRASIAAMNPFEAKRAIRDKKKYPWITQWDKEYAREVMTTAIACKFSKETSWGKLLELTEDWEIVEWNNWGDLFWGKDIKTGKGENHLGKILMKRREYNRWSG